MSLSLRVGWNLVKAHRKLIILLFIYQALWGFFLYRTMDQLFSPLLLRYPKLTNSNELLQLFWIEAEFQLTKTSVLIPYLLGLAGLLLGRMLITPILQSGLNYSLYTMSQGEQNTSFRKGISICWKNMMLTYWIKSFLMLTPLVWLLKPLAAAWNTGNSPIIALQEQPSWFWMMYLLWIVIIFLLFYIIQLGIGAQLSPTEAIQKSVKHMISVILVALTLSAIYSLISVSVLTLSVVWVTFISFLLYQLLPLIRSIFKIWTIAAQYAAIGNKFQ